MCLYLSLKLMIFWAKITSLKMFGYLLRNWTSVILILRQNIYGLMASKSKPIHVWTYG